MRPKNYIVLPILYLILQFINLVPISLHETGDNKGRRLPRDGTLDLGIQVGIDLKSFVG
jgi:hypothetical protein